MGERSDLPIDVLGLDGICMLRHSDRVCQKKEYPGNCSRDMGLERNYHVKKTL